MYRQTAKYKEICSKMGKASAAARERARLEGSPVELPPELPELRREARHCYRAHCYAGWIDRKRGSVWARYLGGTVIPAYPPLI